MTDIGVLHYYLGIQFHQKDEFIVMSQPKYTLKLLDRFNMKECKPMATPMEINLKLSNDINIRKFDE